MTNLRSKLTYANVMASIAVFAALGGGAFAASIKAEKNSVVSKSIKNGKVRSGDLRDGGVNTADLAGSAVTSAQIADNSVASADLADGEVGSADLADESVTGADIADGAIAGADLADESVTGADVNENSLGLVRNSDHLDGLDSSDFLQHGTTIPAGVTVRGIWGGGEAGAGNPMIQDYNFPAASAESLSNNDINFGGAGISANVGNDDDPSCTGFATGPTAPPGKVCIYVTAGNLSASNNTAEGEANQADNRRGFTIRGPVNAAADVEAHGTWAYTAP